jgi:hypothetical protein
LLVISLKFFDGGRFHELSDQGHGSIFLYVRRGFRGASASTGTNVGPGDGTTAGQ